MQIYCLKVHIDFLKNASGLIFLLILQTLEIWGDSAGKSRHLVTENKNKGPASNPMGIRKSFQPHSNL